jgi:hypothetical protein
MPLQQSRSRRNDAGSAPRSRALWTPSNTACAVLDGRFPLVSGIATPAASRRPELALPTCASPDDVLAAVRDYLEVPLGFRGIARLSFRDARHSPALSAPTVHWSGGRSYRSSSSL